MSKHARKPGYVEFCGTWVSPRGKQIYEALVSGMLLRDVSDKFEISMGAASGYAERARKYGVLKRRTKRRIICAVSKLPGSEGQRYEFMGRRAVEEAGFDYPKAYYYSSLEREFDGYAWFFK